MEGVSCHSSLFSSTIPSFPLNSQLTHSDSSFAYKTYNMFSILYYNAQSLLPKLSELQLIAEAYSPNVICIVETWLNADILDREVSIPGYQIVRLDRNRNGGGVLMYVSCKLQFSVLPCCEGLELLTVIIGAGSCKACISLFYRPPSSLSSLLDSLCAFLASIQIHQFTNFIFVGDFNINFCTHSCHPHFPLLESMFQSFGLHQVVREPTHAHHNGSTSLIDLVFVTNPLLTNSCHVIPPLSNSDHHGVSVQFCWKSSHRHTCDNHSKGRVIWCFNQADWERAGTLINDFDWNSLMSDDINESWSRWCKQFLSIMEECIPKRTLPQRKNLPWLTKRLIRSIQKRNLLYKRGKISGDLSKYRIMRNRVTSELRQAKRNFFQLIDPKKPKEFWKAVKFLNKQQSSVPSLTDEDGNEAHTSFQKADMLNSFFSKCFNPLSAPLDESGSGKPSHLDEFPDELFCDVDRVHELLLGLDTSKSNGPDGISARMLKQTAASIAPSITQFIDQIRQSSASVEIVSCGAYS